ncbi:hypothetical protein ACFV4M_31240 [Kitasatospora indigofera]|uniref:hypothetical protein n=1 Tax=Kitasatospora indigofera TaxID=67307 RepID=UPI003663A2FC
MIVTMTPGPGLDRTYEPDRLHRGAVNRAAGVRLPGRAMPARADLDPDTVRVTTDLPSERPPAG